MGPKRCAPRRRRLALEEQMRSFQRKGISTLQPTRRRNNLSYTFQFRGPRTCEDVAAGYIGPMAAIWSVAAAARDQDGDARALPNVTMCDREYRDAVAPASRAMLEERTHGRTPSGLIAENGVLFGVTSFGGGNGCSGNGCGIVFEASATGPEQVLYRFRGGADGDNPSGNLAVFSGSLYGATTGGGSGHGTRFQITLTSTVTPGAEGYFAVAIRAAVFLESCYCSMGANEA